MRQKVGLQLSDARPILHIAAGFRFVHFAVLRRQRRDRALHVSGIEDRCSSTRRRSPLAQLRAQAEGVFPHRVENAALAFDPAVVAGSENAVEQFVGNHFRGQRAVAARPAQIALNAFAERLTSTPTLQRPEAALSADFGGDELIDGRSATRAAVEGRARYERNSWSDGDQLPGPGMRAEGLSRPVMTWTSSRNGTCGVRRKTSTGSRDRSRSGSRIFPPRRCR